MNALYVVGVFLMMVPLICGIVLRVFRIGFDTKIARQSDESWAYAHKLSGKIMLIYAAFTIPLFTVLLVIFHDFFYNQYNYLMCIFGIVSDTVIGVIMVVITQIKTSRFNLGRMAETPDREAAENPDMKE